MGSQGPQISQYQELLNKCKKEKIDKAKNVLVEAKTSFGKSPVERIKLYTIAIAHNTNNRSLHMERAKIFLELHLYGSALSDYVQAKMIREDDSIWLLMAQAYNGLGKIALSQKCKRIYTARVLKLQPIMDQLARDFADKLHIS